MSQTVGHDLDQRCINTARILSIDMSEKAKSGHPGLPLGAAPMAYTLWDRILRHNPVNPRWANRDRFVLSAGHGCELLYSLLHLTGYNISIDDLQNFRQWGSKTTGHPEYDSNLGIEATTGPLGQGIAMAVGMAVAEAHLAARFNRDGFPIVEHFTFVLAGDGDLMEGISSEAASLAGTLQLGKLICLYDNNHVTLDATTDHVFTEDRSARFESFGWHVISVSDGNNLGEIEAAIRESMAETQRPSLIAVRTHIGYGSPLHDSPKVHGEPMGPENARATRKNLGWPDLPPFSVPAEVQTHFRQAIPRGTALETEWNGLFGRYSKKYPDLSHQLKNMMDGVFPENWDSGLPSFSPCEGARSTRDASGKVMNAIAAALPGFVGGSADLAGSNRTTLNGLGDLGFGDNRGRNIHFGVREHAMAAMVNGMALHGGLIPFGATFFNFSDYMRPSLTTGSSMPHRRWASGIGSTDDSLMRLAPVPLFFVHSPIKAIERSGESSRTTHGAASAIDACRYFGGLIVGAVLGVTKEELLSDRYAPVQGFWRTNRLVREIDEIAAGSFKRLKPPEIKGTGYVVKCLEAALWAFYNSDSFRDGCLLAVNLGDDADTTGAVYGQIAGAHYGVDGIPEDWRRKLARAELITSFADDLQEHKDQRFPLEGE